MRRRPWRLGFGRFHVNTKDQGHNHVAATRYVSINKGGLLGNTKCDTHCYILVRGLEFGGFSGGSWLGEHMQLPE